METYGALRDVGDVGEALSGDEASSGENDGTLHFDGCVCLLVGRWDGRDRMEDRDLDVYVDEGGQERGEGKRARQVF